MMPILQVISFIIAFLLQQYQPPAPPAEKLVYEHPIYRPLTNTELQYSYPVYKMQEGGYLQMNLNKGRP